VFLRGFVRFCTAGPGGGRTSRKDDGFKFLRKLKAVKSFDKAGLAQLPNSGNYFTQSAYCPPGGNYLFREISVGGVYTLLPLGHSEKALNAYKTSVKRIYGG